MAWTVCTQPSLPAVVAVAVLFLLPLGSPLSLPLKPDAVPSDPCLEFAKRSGTKEGTAAITTVAPAFEVRCPRYHPNVFDGKVCLGCFRDDYEIANWGKFSCEEKAYALEDACDRLQAAELVKDNEDESEHQHREETISVEELQRQGLVWRALAAKASKGATSTPNPDELALEVASNDIGDQPSLTDMAKSNQNLNRNGSVFTLDTGSVVATSNTFAATIPIPSSVTVSTDAPVALPKVECLDFETDCCAPMTERPKTGLPRNQTEDEQSIPPPPTPCTRICRYNGNCYDGKVCIGCFRDTHDIAQWSSMSPAEKMFSLEDAADRCRDLSSDGKDTDTCFEGGSSEDALRDQASLWGAWKK